MEDDRKNESFISNYFSALGRKGAKARADKLTPERRTEIALKGSQTRWLNHVKKKRKKTKE